MVVSIYAQIIWHVGLNVWGYARLNRSEGDLGLIRAVLNYSTCQHKKDEQSAHVWLKGKYSTVDVKTYQLIWHRVLNYSSYQHKKDKGTISSRVTKG